MLDDFVIANYVDTCLFDEDVSTDGKWCYIVFWVVGSPSTRWGLLKNRLSEACPSCSSASGILFYQTDLLPPKPPDVFLLKFCCHDRRGLLHGNHRSTSRCASMLFCLLSSVVRFVSCC